MTNKKSIIPTILCNQCQTKFYPFGKKASSPPIVGKYKCPECDTETVIVWDRDIARAKYRKTHGLDSPIVQKSDMSAISATELKYEILAIKSQIDDLSEQVSDLKNTIEAVIPETQEFIKNVIVEIMKKQEKSKKSNFQPV